MISIVNMTTYNGSVGGGPATVTIPATTAGNTLVLLEADYGQGGGNIGFQPTLGGVNLVQSPADVAFLATGANIWYLQNIAAGQTSVSWAAVSPGAAVVYELTPCTYNQSANDLGGNMASPSEVATAIGGSGNNAYFVVIGQGRPSSTPAGSYNSVSSPWVLDFSQSGLFFGFLGATDHGMGGFAHTLNATGVQQATFALSNFQIFYGSSAISFADSVTTGNILIRKATVPGGLPQSFTFTPSYGAPFQLTDGQSNNSGPLAPGTYSVVETPLSTFNTSVSSNPAAIVVTAGQTTTVTFTNTKLSTCAPLAQSGNPVDGVFIQDLSLFIIPSSALYTSLVPFADIRVNESSLQGRNSVILDFNNSEGLYVRDLGTIFTWPMTAHTELYVWQPSIIPLDDDMYPRLSFHFLMKGLETVGWGHIREFNIPFSSTTDLTLLLTFDTGAVPSSISITIPNSGGQESKTKITMPPNKFKLVEGFLSSAQPFLLWENDMECKIKSWGSAEPYRIVKPFFG